MRPRTLFTVAGCFGVAMSTSALGQSWITFTEQTSARLIADPGLGSNDPEEKDLAWADFDQDGDIDIVNARKQPFTTIGRKRNVLFMNEGTAEGQSVNGVLVDRTTEFASAADDGGQGMLDLTADRDIIAVDVNGDGWVDLVTATTYGQGLAKSISHPRVYINLGEVDGVWQGFKYEQARIPELSMAPNFCGVGAGDVNGDKAPDLYLVDYDNITPTSYEDILLINDGNGYFVDETNQRMTAAMTSSGFGTTANIYDMNGDGWLDIVKSENGPVKTIYNGGDGNFTVLQNTYSGAGYFASVNDINEDGRMDIVISDDGTDRYLMNTGNSGVQANFLPLNFPPNSGGFGSSSRYADLNQDGFLDVLISDVDVDIPGCDRELHLYRNLGNPPYPTMAAQGSGGIPANMLKGTHDVAPIDLDGDLYPDLVIARCSGIQIWMNQPPTGLVFTYPLGFPGFLPTNTPHTFQVQLSANGGGTPLPDSAVLHYSIEGATTVDQPLTHLGNNLYEATFPAVPCTSVVRFWISGQLDDQTVFFDPATVPVSSYIAIAADGTEITLDDGIEGDTSNWTIGNGGGLIAGGWEQADPNGTINFGVFASPEDDNGAGDHVKAFVTQNGAPGGQANASDVDGGPTVLMTPLIDLAGVDATISYDRWFYCEDAGTPDGDFLTVEVTNNDGQTWHFVHNTPGTGSAWQTASFRVGEFVAPTANVRVRFSVSDVPNNSVTEAGVDNLVVEELICGQQCLADIAGDNGAVDVDDLLMLINAWGPCADPDNCPADIYGADDQVNVDDLLELINAWGPCQ